MVDVIYIDDNPSTALPTLRAVLGARLLAVHYDESDEFVSVVTKEFREAKVIVSDFILHSGDVGRSSFAIADGRAINDISYAISRGATKDGAGQLRMILTAELSSVEEVLDEELSKEPFLLARQLNADWVGLKSNAKRFAEEVLVFLGSLESVSAQIRKGGEMHSDQIAGALLPEDVAWRELAIDDLSEAMADLSATVDSERPAGILRWLCHSIFPFPHVLLSPVHVAARLGIEQEWVTENLQRLHADSLGCYKGPLKDLHERRWWRAGFDSWLWNASQGSASSRDALAATLKLLGCTEPRWLPFSDPVVVTDEVGRPVGIESASVVVRIVPRFWPGTLGNSFAAISEVKRNSALRKHLLPSDQARLAEVQNA